jgi:hypothetical protein
VLTLRSVLYLLILVFPLGLWGLAFEVSYLAALDVPILGTLQPWHYFANGGVQIFTMAVTLFIYASVKKFFTEKIHADDLKLFKSAARSADFKNELLGARVAVLISIGYWLAVYFGTRVVGIPNISDVYMFMVFVNLSWFLMCIVSSPAPAKLTVITMLVLSITICFAAGGYGQAKRSLMLGSNLRDDYIVKIQRSNGRLHAKATSFPFPVTWKDAKRQFFGE